MAHTVEWTVANHVNPDSVYDTVVDFWADSRNEESKVTQHLNNDTTFVSNKWSTLSGDKKSVTHTKVFLDEVTYNNWSTAKDSLPAIDEDLTYTPV